MTEKQFWKLIDSSRSAVQAERDSKKGKLPKHPGDDFLDRQTEWLKQKLAGMTPQEVVGYAQQFWAQLSRAYRWDLWGAAYLMEGGCGNDGFMDFRSTLISLGKELFTSVLKDPDSLAHIYQRPDVPFLQSEGFQYVAIKVYREKTGKGIWDDHEAASQSKEPAGKRFDFDDEQEMTRRYPKLAAKFLDED